MNTGAEDGAIPANVFDPGADHGRGEKGAT
jgi:hypothetical protein